MKKIAFWILAALLAAAVVVPAFMSTPEPASPASTGNWWEDIDIEILVPSGVSCVVGQPCRIVFSTEISDLSLLPQGWRMLWELEGPTMTVDGEPSIGLYGTSAIYYMVFSESGTQFVLASVRNPVEGEGYSYLFNGKLFSIDVTER